jgi:benzodiazapine receptor
MKPNAIAKLVVCLVVTLSAGFIGSFFTRPAISGWYSNLNKPFFTPPGWLFGPVWTALYLLMAVSAFIIWQKGLALPAVKTALALYLLQLALNFLWTPVFFGLKMPLLAFVEILLLCAAVVLTIRAFARISIFASALLLPYILWTCFAAVLNFSIWFLNR